MFSIGQDINNNQLDKAIEFCKQNEAFINLIDDSHYRIFSSQIDKESKESSVRLVRNLYLQKYDFTQVADAPFTEDEKKSYAEYRQYLRDYTKTKDFYKILPKSFEEWLK